MARKADADTARPTARLPEALRPWCVDDLIRLGADCDGGYLVRRADIDATEILISLGVYDDWSFERDFLRRNDIPLVAYDASVDSRFFALQILAGVARLHRPRHLIRAIGCAFDYPRFFSGRRRHIRKHVGPGDPARYARFAEVERRIGDARVFFKIDIEGGEYRILDDLLRLAPQISGLVIEFHKCDRYLARILDFVAACPLALVHVHPNNYAPLDEHGLPLAFEMTFSAAGVGSTAAQALPHPLDRPNNPLVPDPLVAFRT